MSQTPLDAEGVEPDAQGQAYLDGWAAISRLARRGFSWSGNERNSAFLNMGAAGFADVSASSGFDFGDDGRALALLDWDHDGDLDLLLGNRNGPRVRFLENRTQARGLTLELIGQAGQRAAIGASAQLYLKGVSVPLLRAVRGGEGYLAQSSARLHFGLGQAEVERVVVRWPDGVQEEFVGDFGASILRLVRGSAAPAPLLPKIPSTGDSLAELPAPKRSAAQVPERAGRRVVLTQPIPMPTLEVSGLNGESVELFGVQPGGTARGTGRPLLLNIWASWCAPCVKELKGFQEQRELLEEAGITWFALSADEDPAAAVGLMESLAWPYQWGFIPQLSLDVLDAMQAALLDHDSPMPLPSSFLVDAEGMLRVIYMGPIDVQQLARDKRLLELSREALRDASVPFAGIWWGQLQDQGIGIVETRFLLRGLDAAADEYSRAGFQVAQKSRAELLYGFARESASQGNMKEATRHLRQAVSEDPGFFKAQFELGALLHQAGDLHAAIGAYMGAIAADESHQGSHYNLGLAYLGTGQLRSAKKQLAWLAAHDQGLAEALQAAIEVAEAQRENSADG